MVEIIYHYPLDGDGNEINDGSLEPQPCTCGSEHEEDCHCNDFYVHVEFDPEGRQHVWSSLENYIHHPEWEEIEAKKRKEFLASHL